MKEQMLERLTRKNTRKNLLAMGKPQFELIFTDTEKKSFQKTINNRLNYLSLTKRNVDDAGKVHFNVNLLQKKGCVFIVEIKDETFDNEEDFFQYEIYPFVRKNLVRSRLWVKFDNRCSQSIFYQSQKYLPVVVDSVINRIDTAFRRLDRLDKLVSEKSGQDEDYTKRFSRVYGKNCLIIFNGINKLNELIDKSIEKAQGCKPGTDN